MEDFNNKNIEEEINFQNVLKTPIRWFGIVYPYFIILIVIGGLYYVSNLNSINENKIKPTVIDSTRIKKRAHRAYSCPDCRCKCTGNS